MDLGDAQENGSSRKRVAIAARGIEMVFNSKTHPFRVLQAIDLTVFEGELQMVVGPSGAGKTTLLLILSGLLTPTRGKVYLFGKEIVGMDREERTQFRRHHLGILFEEGNLFRSLTALENVELGFALKGFRPSSARRQARHLLESVGLGDRANHLPRYLSGGEQQRVAMARALAGNPPLIVADEPTSALDSQNGRVVVSLLRDLVKQQGCTAILTTHDPRILGFADRIVEVEDGVLIQAESQTPIDKLNRSFRTS
ncbi:MAG TPA: ABC transporter ATP-binding protein [Oscillatoriales cyanobacterium M59_W2019_021]|nr:ABC transporter ATP-binding protein [Oscillatoriales cyanobacterium M4454_W2019_049]HIK52379.1 ABC transporter ATP-binding protein [Oscillatoriales cyanobacterium M59_W2019_021]